MDVVLSYAKKPVQLHDGAVVLRNALAELVAVPIEVLFHVAWKKSDKIRVAKMKTTGHSRTTEPGDQECC